MIKKWTLNILIGGDPDETVSSRLGKLKVKRGVIPWYRPLAKTLDENHYD